MKVMKQFRALSVHSHLCYIVVLGFGLFLMHQVNISSVAPTWRQTNQSRVYLMRMVCEFHELDIGGTVVRREGQRITVIL